MTTIRKERFEDTMHTDVLRDSRTVPTVHHEPTHAILTAQPEIIAGGKSKGPVSNESELLSVASQERGYLLPRTDQQYPLLQTSSTRVPMLVSLGDCSGADDCDDWSQK